jgi:hypothetical protein
MTEIRPNFFIVGAPKSGTTALYEYLSTHPQVCMAAYKEPHYFADDLHGYARATSLKEYLAFFQHCNDRAVAIGEGSVWYLRSRSALSRIREFAPDGRIIIMLRNPVELVHSFHAQALYSYIEDEADLETAWNLQDTRQRGHRIPAGNQAIQTLMYGDMAKLGEQVDNALSIFPREQVRIIYFEDFIADTLQAYRDTLSFLGIDDDDRTSFPPVNEAKGHRFKWLGKATLQAPRPIVSAVRFVRQKTGLDPMRAVRAVRQWNTVKQPKAQLTDEFRRELIDYFRDDVRLLERLTNRDLSHWLAER